MSHIHIPDGVLPIEWWMIGYLLTGILVIVAVKKIEKKMIQKKIPYLGVLGALMLITMSIPLGIIPFHINLTVLTGIIAGPWLGFLAVFIVNLLLSFIGHGGITVVGVNTLVLGLEVMVGALLFRWFSHRFRPTIAAGMVTVIALLISTSLMVGIVGGSQIGLEYALPHDHSHEALHSDETIPSDEEIQLEDHHHEENDPRNGEEEHGIAERLSEVSVLGMTGLVAILFILAIGIGLETGVTVLIVRFFQRVRPDLLR